MLVSLAQSLSPEVQDIVGTLGILISHLPKRAKVKRKYFSTMARSTRDRHKKALLSAMERYNEEVSAKAFVALFKTVVHLWIVQLDEMMLCGLKILDKAIPVQDTVDKAAASLGEDLGDIGGTSEKNMDEKILKVALLTETVKKNPDIISNSTRGCARSLAKSFGVSTKMAKKVIQKTKNEQSPREIATRKSKETVLDTKWPELVQQFCLTKPICREAPGESVSVAYGKREEKFIRQFPIKEIYKLFCIKYPDFKYKLTTFRTLVPKNLVKPNLRDVKQNVCPLHENVKRCIKGFNRFMKKNKMKNLLLPTSTIDVCLVMICNPNKENAEINRNPLNWNPKCTKGDCDKCPGNSWFASLLKTITSNNELKKKDITCSQWISEREGKKTRQVLRQLKMNIIKFIQEVLQNCLLENKFPEHLRKAWNQWQITKYPLTVTSNDPNDVAIRTREDYQEDIKFLCMSETVSTHRGIGVITMVCYPIVMEVFFPDGSKELRGIIYLSNTKNKNFDTVRYFEERCVDYVRKTLGHNVVRFDRITDGCSSQYWCYGTCHHLETMPAELDIPLINFHRYERYEGKNFSDALGSILKRKMRSGALQNKVYGNNEESMKQILEEIDDDTDLDDLVFENQIDAFQWLQMCMSKGEENSFSKSFKSIELFWIPKEEIPVGRVVEVECRKIPQVKSYNMATATKGTIGVHVRDSSCYNCENCLQGKKNTSCTSSKNGHWTHRIVQKELHAAFKSGSIDMEDSNESDIDEEEMVYNSDEDYTDESSADETDDGSDDDTNAFEEIPHVSESWEGFVLYKYMEAKYYVGSVIDQSGDQVSVKLARRYVANDKTITFTWPDIDDIVTPTNTEKVMRSLPNPARGRRGTAVTYNNRVFGKIPVAHIF